MHISTEFYLQFQELTASWTLSHPDDRGPETSG